MYQKYTGIILKKHPLGEADELLTVYTNEQGKIRVRAAGTRKIQSKLAGHLQSLNEIEFEVAGRSTGSGQIGNSLPVLISVRLITLNSYLRDDLKKFAYALIGVETLYRITPDEEVSAEIYQSLVSFFKNLGEVHDENLEVRKFQLKLLAASGYTFSPSVAAHAEQGQTDGIRFTPELERSMDQFLVEVLEREIKSNGFLKTLNQER